MPRIHIGLHFYEYGVAATPIPVGHPLADANICVSSDAGSDKELALVEEFLGETPFLPDDGEVFQVLLVELPDDGLYIEII